VEGPITIDTLKFMDNINHFWGLVRGMLESSELTVTEAKN